jgi:hypothetical protein
VHLIRITYSAFSFSSSHAEVVRIENRVAQAAEEANNSTADREAEDTADDRRSAGDDHAENKDTARGISEVAGDDQIADTAARS